MDVWERVREVRAGEELTDARIDGARDRLLAGIAEEQASARRPLRRQPMFLVATAFAGVALVAVGAAVVHQATRPAPGVEAVPTAEPTPPPAPNSGAPFERATAETVLDAAAGAVSSRGVLEAAPGQYLRVEHQTAQLVLYQPTDQFTMYSATRASATAGWIATSSYARYIPGDRSQEWVKVFEPVTEITQTFGAGAEGLAGAWLDQRLKERIVTRHAGGEDDGSDPSIGSDAYYAQIPRDPQQLIAWYGRNTGDQAIERNSAIAKMIIEELERSSAPADLRSALFLALRQIPGGQVVSVDGTVVTLSYRFVGTTDSFDEWTQTLTVDTATGFVSGSSITWGSGGGVVPDSVPSWTVSTSISIVDSAP